MDIQIFMDVIDKLGVDFYTGVPDSLLMPLCDYIMTKYGISKKHIVAANEGAAVGLAAGHYIATSRPALIYMQNSGIGNAVNPICSLLHKKVYAIPAVFVIGWRGEPGIKDEPQHIFQGEITLPLLKCLDIPYVVISKDTIYKKLTVYIDLFNKYIKEGQSIAFVIKKDSLQNKTKAIYKSDAGMSREQILKLIINYSQGDEVFICTTGKLSREMFELREQGAAGHGHDFLTVGSMGHSIMIAHGIAASKPEKKVFCLDGDGSVIMHLGSLAVAGVHHPENLIHIVINNGAHETVGGMPTVGAHLKLSEISLKLGYEHSYCIFNEEELIELLNKVKNLKGPIFIEAVCNLKSRSDLGRPTSTPIQNRNEFMEFLSREGND